MQHKQSRVATMLKANDMPLFSARKPIISGAVRVDPPEASDIREVAAAARPGADETASERVSG